MVQPPASLANTARSARTCAAVSGSSSGAAAFHPRLPRTASMASAPWPAAGSDTSTGSTSVTCFSSPRLRQLLDEQALSAHLRQRPVEDAIAGGGDAHQLGGLSPCGEQLPDALRLPERQRALARPDAQRGHLRPVRGNTSAGGLPLGS